MRWGHADARGVVLVRRSRGFADGFVSTLLARDLVVVGEGSGHVKRPKRDGFGR
jgi:hypothetical protein